MTVAVVGIPLFWLMHSWTWPAYVTATIMFTGVSVWIHQVGDRILGEKDSRKLVWDELVGFLIAASLLPFTWRLALLLFVVERTIDIVKVPPARWIERCWPGGWGVVGDDVVAGLYTCGLVHILLQLNPGWLGMLP